MNRYSVLLTVILIVAGGKLLAQTTGAKEETEKVKEEHRKETENAGEKPAATIKVVPAARNKNAKPAKVTSAKPRIARPGARNPRPSSRPTRPGNGRN